MSTRRHGSDRTTAASRARMPEIRRNTGRVQHCAHKPGHMIIAQL
ncbi:MAG: hypothetical protein ACYCVM_05865 [Acidiferrobacter sp.]